MEPLTLKIIFVIGIAISSIIRKPHERNNKQNVIVDDRQTGQEKGLLFLVSLGMAILPMFYIVTPWLNFANYRLPIWAHVLGIATFAIALWLFWRSHHDLGRNWSASLQVREDHTLITRGIYNKIRHPMYTSIWLWVIAQALLLTNWIAGLSGLLTFGILYFARVDNEERMMMKQFGEQYRTYMGQTKRLLPYLF